MPKTLMSYPRPFYVFSPILYLNKRIRTRYMISGSYVHYRQSRWFSGSFWSRKEEGEENWQQRRDVPASRRLNVPASRRLNVAASGQQKKKSTNVATSRRLNVATSSRFLPQNHKKKKRPNLEALKSVRTEARKIEQ